MVHDRPSLTALAVSFARAVATVDARGPAYGIDPVAMRLLPLPLRLVVDAAAAGARFSRVPLLALRALSMGVINHAELRSLAIDEVARAALDQGATQIVILGAGLDARAWRLPEAANARTFEVDHPATQGYKRARAGRAEGHVRFVAVDFQKDSLDERLAAAGHDVKARTLWIWEGVTMYLPHEATIATLKIVSARSAAGSTIAMTYVTPDMVSLPPAMMPLVRAGFHALGEPLHGLLTPPEVKQTFDAMKITLEDDTGVPDWIARFAPSHRVRVRIAERLAVGTKRPNAA